MKDEELVEMGAGCPGCGERRADELLWRDDNHVRCATCGMVYAPAALRAAASKDGEDTAMLVGDGWACPGCNERRIDELVWQSDGEVVRCATCGTEYVPGGEVTRYGEPVRWVAITGRAARLVSVYAHTAEEAQRRVWQVLDTNPQRREIREIWAMGGSRVVRDA